MESVLIYQMGKVGSAAIRDSLSEIGVSNFQVHYLQEDAVAKLTAKHVDAGLKIPPHLIRSKEIISGRLLDSGDTRIITLIRDPVSRNVSAFFQNIDSYFPKGSWRKASSEVLIQTFMDRYPHRVAITWFDSEFKKITGFDVLAADVDASKGTFTFRHGKFRILLIKVEAADADKEKAIGEFVGLTGRFQLLKTNIGDEKNYSDAYKEFKSRIMLPKEYLDLMYESALIRKFYTDGDIQKFRKKWEG